MRVLIGCAAMCLVLGTSARANAATIGYFQFDPSGSPFIDAPFSINILDGTIAPTDYLTELELTLFSGGAVDQNGHFQGTPIANTLTFSIITEDPVTGDQVVGPLPAFIGGTTLACSDSPICGAGFADLSYDSAILTAKFSQPGYDVTIAPLLNLDSTDPFGFAATPIDVTQTPVPEPSTLLLLASGAAFAFRRRRSYTAERR